MWWGTPQHVNSRRAEAAEAEKMAAAVPSLGSVPLDLDVKGCPAGPADLNSGLQSLLARKECCDVVFVAGDESIEAHAVVLAASSASFCTFLRQNQALGLSMPAEGPREMEEIFSIAKDSEGVEKAETKISEPTDLTQTPVETAAEPPAESAVPAEQPAEKADEETAPKVEGTESGPLAEAQDGASEVSQHTKLQIHVKNLSSSEALLTILDYIYKGFGGVDWQYHATSAQVNKDVLRLSRHFGFSHLHEHAARWLATGLTTENVLERLVTCEEFGLGLLREKITERLALRPAELMLVCSSPEITKHPRILQDLLVQVASLKDKKEEEKDEVVEKEEKPEKEKKPTKAEKMEKKEKPHADKPPTKRRKAGGA